MKITNVQLEGPLPVPVLDGGGWVTQGEITVSWLQDGVKRAHTTPSGYNHDGPSVPKIVRSFMPWHPVLFRASAIHDDAYQHHTLSRQVADRLFYEMIKLDQNIWKYNTGLTKREKLSDLWSLFKAWRKRTRAYVGVRMFGWFAYNN